MVENQPMILTNSHIIQGQRKVKLRLPERLLNLTDINDGSSMNLDISFEGEGTVVKDYPVSDFALVSIPNTLSLATQLALKYYATLNGILCADGLENCKNDWNVPFKSLNINNVDSIFSGKRNSNQLDEKLTPVKVEDYFISGLYKNVILIPNISPIGISGGGFYSRGELQGLITRVSSDGAAITVAIPMSEIARVITENGKVEDDDSSGDRKLKIKNIKWLASAEIENSLSFDLSYFDINDNEIVEQIFVENNANSNSVSSGGPTGSSGGPTGSSGGSSEYNGESIYWNIKLQNDQKSKTTNPFLIHEGRLKVNGRVITAIHANGKLYSPTLANYLFLRNNAVDSLELIESTNYLKSKNITQFKYGRLNIKLNTGEIMPIYPNCDTLGNDGSQALNSDFDLNPDNMNCAVFLKSQNTKKKNEIYKGFPFSSNINNNLIDISFPVSNETNKILCDNNLEEIIESHNNANTTLKVVSKNPSFYLYQSEDKKKRALLIFDNQNLSVPYRFILESETYVVELFNCRIGLDKGCFR